MKRRCVLCVIKPAGPQRKKNKLLVQSDFELIHPLKHNWGIHAWLACFVTQKISGVGRGNNNYTKEKMGMKLVFNNVGFRLKQEVVI